MIKLMHRAAELSGVTLEEAGSLDETNVFERIGFNMGGTREGADWGEAVLTDLCTKAFEKIYADRQIARLFRSVKQFEIVNTIVEYLQQRLGGSSHYGERRGQILMLRRHLHLNITSSVAERCVIPSGG